MSRLSRVRKLAIPLAAIGIGCLAGLVLVEVMLRVLWPGVDSYYVWPPHLEASLDPSPEIVHGVSGKVHYKINSLGLRGEEFSPDRAGEYRILVIGGSTSECIMLDQDDTWPELVGTMLGQTADGRKVWIGNSGRAGYNTRDHLGFMRLALDQYDVDALIVLAGANDVELRLIQGDDYNPRFVEDTGRFRNWLRTRFAMVPLLEQRADEPLHRRTAVYQLARFAQQFYWSWKRIDRDSKAEWVARARDRRTRAHFLDELPSLESGLDEYRRNIEQIVQEARKRSLPILFLTQPTIWKEDMSEEELSKMWWGLGPGEEILTEEIDAPGIYTPEALETVMAAYNRRLLETCADLDVPCFDIAPRVPQTLEMYFDDMHYTVAGSRRFAEELAGYLESQEPFAAGPRQSRAPDARPVSRTR
jgi:lysophospholipase L1-like esterase